MSLLKNNKVFFSIILFLIIQNYIPSEYFFIIGVIYLLYYFFFKENMKFIKPLKECRILILFVIWGILMGLIYSVLHSNITARDFIRDIFYHINPLIYIYIGAIYAKNKIDIYKIFNSFIIAGGVLSILQLINVFLNFSNIISTYSVNSWRSIAGQGVMVGSISIAIILSGIIPKEKRLSKSNYYFLLVMMSADFLITMSRTNLLIFMVSYFIFSVNKENKVKVIKFLVFFVASLIIVYLILYKFLPNEIRESYINKLISSGSEISSKHNWNTLAEIQQNWRGYETYCALQQWKESHVINQIFGSGFGKRIYVGEYAYLLLNQVDANGNPTDTIAVLHNGYSTMLIKLGVLGVIFYIIFYFLLIKKAIKGMKILKNIESKTLLIIAITLLMQTYFLNGLYKDVCFYPLIILIGYCSYIIENEINKHKNEEEICLISKK